MVIRPLVIHSLDHARVALATAATLGVPVTLISAPGSAAYSGALWFREVITIAVSEEPDVEVRAILDCGDKAGLVMSALRQGLNAVRFTGRKAVADKLAAMAAATDAVVITERLPCCDLLDQPEPEALCRAWLEKYP